MRKHLIALAMALALAALMIACGSGGATNEYVPPATEVTTVEEATSELSGETSSQAAESETAAQSEGATSSSAGTTTQALAMGTTRATTTTTTTRTTITAAPKPQPPAPQPVLEYEVMGPEFLGTALNALNEIRAEFGLAPMREDAALMASSLELAWKMARAEDCFHSENPHGCESVAYYPSQFFSAHLVGERLTYHSPGFREEQNVRVGIAVVQYDGYLYCVLQGDC
jgi:uncharacterized protein YkwD